MAEAGVCAEPSIRSCGYRYSHQEVEAGKELIFSNDNAVISDSEIRLQQNLEHFKGIILDD